MNSLSDGELAQFRLARKIISDAYKLIKETAMPPEMLVDMPPPLTALDQAILELQYAQRDPNPVRLVSAAERVLTLAKAESLKQGAIEQATDAAHNDWSVVPFRKSL